MQAAGISVSFIETDKVPQPSSGAYCPHFKCNSCCNDEKLMDHLGEVNSLVDIAVYD